MTGGSPTPPVEAGDTRQTPGGRSAALARRLGALVYEALLLAALALIAGFLLLPLVTPSAAHASTLAVPTVFLRTMLFCALAAGGAIYCTWFWSDGRRTLPQKTWKLRLVDIAGGPLTRRVALTRYAAGWIGPAAALAASVLLRPLGLGRYAATLLALNYVWALVDPAHQFLHDRIARTRLVDDADAGRPANQGTSTRVAR